MIYFFSGEDLAQEGNGNKFMDGFCRLLASITMKADLGIAIGAVCPFYNLPVGTTATDDALSIYFMPFESGNHFPFCFHVIDFLCIHCATHELRNVYVTSKKILLSLSQKFFDGSVFIGSGK
jgi:hypothetical protein